MGLDGCLTVGKNIDVPTCVALYCIIHYTNLNGIYFNPEYCGIECKIEATLRSPGSPIQPNTRGLYRSRTPSVSRPGPLCCLRVYIKVLVQIKTVETLNVHIWKHIANAMYKLNSYSFLCISVENGDTRQKGYLCVVSCRCVVRM